MCKLLLKFIVLEFIINVIQGSSLLVTDKGKHLAMEKQCVPRPLVALLCLDLRIIYAYSVI